MSLDMRATDNDERQHDAQLTAATLRHEFNTEMAAAILADLQKHLRFSGTQPTTAAASVKYPYTIRDNDPNCIEVVSANAEALHILAANEQMLEHGARVTRWNDYAFVLTFRR